MKRVLFLDHTAEMSGGEISLLHLLQHLDRSSYHPIVVLCTDGPLREKCEAEGIETHILRLPGDIANTRRNKLSANKLARIKDAFNLIFYCVRLARFLRRKKVDILHANSLKADIIGGVSGRVARVPVIWHIRDRIADDYLPAKVVKGFRLLCRFLPTHVVSISEAVQETLQLPAKKPKTVIHNGVVTSTLTKAEPKSTEASALVHIGLVGRISPWKGQDIFIKAADLVRVKYPNARFEIIGSAMFGEESYEEELRALSNSLGLDGTVIFRGFCPKVMAEMQRMDVIAHCSTVPEPFGKVVIEGMLAGKAVIATRGGGVTEIVVDGVTGILVEMGNVDELAAAINKILENPAQAKAMGDAGYKRVLERFTIEQTAKKVEDLYERMLGKS